MSARRLGISAAERLREALTLKITGRDAATLSVIGLTAILRDCDCRMTAPGALGIHDLGGQAESTIDTTPTPLTFWECQTHALADVCFTKGLWTVDEMRRGIEGLPESAYRELTYYEKWARSLAVILKERGIIQQAELDAALGSGDIDAPAVRFKAGDLVRVKPEDSTCRWRKPHLRTPGYIFGVIGTIERDCVGLSPDPDHVAFREPVTRQPLYRVRFAQSDVWPEYASGSKDTLDIEIHQHWLEPASMEDLEKQEARRAQLNLDRSQDEAHGHNHQDGHEHRHGAADHGDHTHEARHDVESNAVAAEGDNSERSRLTNALIEVLQSKGLVKLEELRATREEVETRGQKGLGAELVVKAWMDPAFKQRLLQNATNASAELGIAVGEPFSKSIAKPVAPKPDEPFVLTAVENTADVHNVIVCTLCSCYPTKLLGTSPHWYRSRSYRARVVREPRTVLREFGTDLPENTAVHVHDSTADLRYIVIPRRPEGTEGWQEERLKELVTRDSMVGVAPAKSPRAVA